MPFPRITPSRYGSNFANTSGYGYVRSANDVMTGNAPWTPAPKPQLPQSAAQQPSSWTMQNTLPGGFPSGLSLGDTSLPEPNFAAAQSLASVPSDPGPAISGANISPGQNATQRWQSAAQQNGDSSSRYYERKGARLMMRGNPEQRDYFRQQLRFGGEQVPGYGNPAPNNNTQSVPFVNSPSGWTSNPVNRSPVTFRKSNYAPNEWSTL